MCLQALLSTSKANNSAIFIDDFAVSEDQIHGAILVLDVLEASWLGASDLEVVSVGEVVPEAYERFLSVARATELGVRLAFEGALDVIVRGNSENQVGVFEDDGVSKNHFFTNDVIYLDNALDTADSEERAVAVEYWTIGLDGVGDVQVLDGGDLVHLGSGDGLNLLEGESLQVVLEVEVDVGLVGGSVEDKAVLSDPDLIALVVDVDLVGVVDSLDLAGDGHDAVVLLAVQVVQVLLQAWHTTIAENLAPWVGDSVVRVHIVLVSAVGISDNGVFHRLHDHILSLILDPFNEPVDALVSDELVVIGSHSAVLVDEVEDAIEGESQELGGLVVHNGDGYLGVLVKLQEQVWETSLSDNGSIGEGDLPTPGLEVVDVSIGKSDDLEGGSGGRDHVDLHVVWSQDLSEACGATIGDESTIEMGDCSIVENDVLDTSGLVNGNVIVRLLADDKLSWEPILQA